MGLELTYLAEIGRLDLDAVQVLADLRSGFGIEPSTAPLADVCRAAASLVWTRDLFDRLIVANAIADGARLVTADEKILENFPGAVW